MQQLEMDTQPVPQQTGASLDAPVLKGSVERVVYFNEENGQCVLDLKLLSDGSHVLIQGRTPHVFPGLTVTAQRDTSELEFTPPNSSRTLKKFLKSGALLGIGPNLATILAKAYPENLFEIFDQAPGKLLEIQGIGRKRQIQILDAWRAYQEISKLEEFLFAENLPLLWGKMIYPFHRDGSISFLKEHPYRAVTEHALSFELMDSFALKYGYPPDGPERVRGCLYDVLLGSYRQGHCAYPEDRLLQEARARLNVSPAAIEESLELELISENLISDTIESKPCIYLKDVWQTEQHVSQKLLAFENRPSSWGGFNSDKFLNWAQELLKIQLAPLQRQAIATALNSPLAVITGGPGTGKTTLIQSLVTILQTQFLKFALCSPTGRAAQRLAEATRTPAKTIHRLLKFNGSTGLFSFNEKNPLDLDLVLVDEASMVDLSLMSSLLNALPDRCSLILVGDSDQIPPVGAGNILQSILQSKRFPVVKLKEIYRQSEQSLIKINAHRINNGEMPLTQLKGTSDFHYIPVNGVDHAKKVIFDLVTRVIPEKCGITDPGQFQILVPFNRGPLGTQKLNEELQSLVSTQDLRAEDSETISGFGQVFRKGDKVMIIKNDYIKDVYNGDIGFLTMIDHSSQMIEVQFDERNIRFGFDELDRLTLAYAISIHKSQGSEYRAVIVVLTDEHLPMAQRHLIYTAVTRGQEHVFLVAEPHALQIAIQSDENNKRWQKLTELLKAPSNERTASSSLLGQLLPTFGPSV
jgi:exodeoxyribonuclease V alpha subunit